MKALSNMFEQALPIIQLLNYTVLNTVL